MPTKIMQLRLALTLVIALAALLASCPTNSQPAGANTQAAAPAAGNSATPPASQDVVAVKPDPAPGSGTAGKAVAGPGIEASSPGQKTGSSDEAEEESEAEEKPPMSKNYRAPEEENHRPRPNEPVSRKQSFKSVELRFLSAKFNEAEDATLSKLEFEFRANLGRMKKHVETLALDDINTAAAANLDLGLCKLEIYPVVQPPNLDGIGSVGAVELRFDGMFQVRVYTADDVLIGIFGIRSDGSFNAAPVYERPEGYSVKAVRREGSYAPVPFTIYRNAAVGEKPEYLVTIQFNGGGTEDRQVEGPDGNLYSYSFPAGRLELYDPNEV